MKPCLDCRLRTERIGWNEHMRKHLERLNAACLCMVPIPPLPRFARSNRAYMKKYTGTPVPASLLALETNLRSARA